MTEIFLYVCLGILAICLIWYVVIPLIAKTQKGVILNLRTLQIKNIKKNIKAFNISKEELFND